MPFCPNRRGFLLAAIVAAVLLVLSRPAPAVLFAKPTPVILPALDSQSPPLPSPVQNWQRAEAGLRPQASITAVLFDPADARRIYAAAAGAEGLWLSTDDGASWAPEGGEVGRAPVYALLAARSGALLAGGGQGLYARPASGAGWQQVDQVPLAPVYALTQETGGEVLAGGSAGPIYRLAAAGGWVPLAPLPAVSAAAPGQPGTPAAVLALAATPAGSLLAGTDGGGLFRSPDGGKSWQAVGEIGPTFVAALHVASDGHTVMARTRRGLYVSPDSGATWQASGSELPGRIDALADQPDGMLLIGSGLGQVYASTDSGLTWVERGRGLGRAGLFFTLQADPAAPGRWYAGTETGLYRSDDGAATWQPLAAGPGRPSALALASDRAGTLYLGTADGVFRSADGAATWQRLATGLPPAGVIALAVSPANPERLYAGMDGAGLYRSDDGGEHWSPTGWTRPGVPGLALDPRDPEHLFMRVAYERVYESRNGGASWAARWNGLGLETQIIGLAWDPAQDGTLYAGGTEGFFRTEDTAVHWQASGPELAGQTVFCFAQSAKGWLYAGTTKGLYGSRDGGEHWEAWGHGLEGITVTDIVLVPARPDDAFAGTRYRGIWATHDGGQTWTPLGDGLDGATINGVEQTADGGWLIAASDRGVYRLAIGDRP